MNAFDYCNDCCHRSGGATLDYDADGHRIYGNGCSYGYDLVSTSELCRRPDACKRHGEKTVVEAGEVK